MNSRRSAASVYNHTVEGNELGPTLSFRGIDNFSYYRTLRWDGLSTGIMSGAMIPIGLLVIWIGGQGILSVAGSRNLRRGERGFCRRPSDNAARFL
ncbi:hypothetical protein [Agrobacterium fabrum]|uniref:hypothetical protein n=1 Tax=Agrobacterium fabrum TaxID=1176649 RepID=UPI0009CC28C1|nr:hypothetical protein [Agrobacterium fabrum]MCR6727607.1 hypothetical protein [Agrobacterium fabrum]CUX52678.1 hypothetical protein AGR8A_pAt20045 [Agrobacterium fabrum str. J-07]